MMDGKFQIWVIDRSSWRGSFLVFAKDEDDLTEKLLDHLYAFCIVHAKAFYKTLMTQLAEKNAVSIVLGYRDQKGGFHCSLCNPNQRIDVPDRTIVQVRIYRK